jgi:hypothetical protein
MTKQYLEDSNGGRTVVGIDPCSEFLQLAILTPNKATEFKKLPLSPSITEEIAKSTDPETTQIAIESYGSYGKLFVYDLLREKLLNGEIFDTLLEAKVVIENWRREYNQFRPHSSLGYRPPAPGVFVPGILTLGMVQ